MRTKTEQIISQIISQNISQLNFIIAKVLINKKCCVSLCMFDTITHGVEVGSKRGGTAQIE